MGQPLCALNVSSAAAASAPRKAAWKWIAAAAVIIALFALWLLLPVQEWLNAFNRWVEQQGIWGYVIFALIYIVATVALAPGALFTLAAGLAFGLWAFPLVVAAATIGASLAFLIARYVAAEKVRGAIAQRPKLQAAERAISEEGWKVVGLMRLSPAVPFNLQNYFFGVTAIPFWQYAAATFFGIMPGTLLYVYLGAAGKAASGDGGGALRWAFLAVGLLATIIVTVFVTRKATAKLSQAGVQEKS